MYLFKLKDADMQPVLEIGKDHGYILVSAISPQSSSKVNSVNSLELSKEIRHMALSNIPIYANLHEIGKDIPMEKSYFVLNYNIKTKSHYSFDKFFEFAIDICLLFNQKNALVYNPDKNETAFFNSQRKADAVFSKETSLQDLFQNYYTSVLQDKNQNYELYVSMPGTIVGKHIASINEEIVLSPKEISNKIDYKWVT